MQGASSPFFLPIFIVLYYSIFMNDWLTDIFNFPDTERGGYPARKAVCSVCKAKAASGDQIFPICRKCDETHDGGLPRSTGYGLTTRGPARNQRMGEMGEFRPSVTATEKSSESERRRFAEILYNQVRERGGTKQEAEDAALDYWIYGS